MPYAVDAYVHVQHSKPGASDVHAVATLLALGSDCAVLPGQVERAEGVLVVVLQHREPLRQHQFTGSHPAAVMDGLRSGRHHNLLIAPDDAHVFDQAMECVQGRLCTEPEHWAQTISFTFAQYVKLQVAVHVQLDLHGHSTPCTKSHS